MFFFIMGFCLFFLNSNDVKISLIWIKETLLRQGIERRFYQADLINWSYAAVNICFNNYHVFRRNKC